MAFFEDELQKMFGKNSPIRDARFVGRACIGRLGDTTNVKLEFVTLDTYQKYEGLKASVFNRNEGAIDTNVFLFAEILGKKPGKSASLHGGITPHVWIYNEKTEWYGYTPTASDYVAIARAVSSYLEVFLEPAGLTRKTEKPVAKHSDGYTSVINAIEAEKAKPRRSRSKPNTNNKRESINRS